MIISKNNLLLSGRLKYAVTYGREMHGDQKRKYTGEPYYTHPERVAQRVLDLGLDEEAAIGAVLHDVVEDTEGTLEDIKDIFGVRVAKIVEMLTDAPTVAGGMNRAARKKDTIARMFIQTRLLGMDVHTIKIIDLWDNADSIEEHDPNFWKVFKNEIATLSDALVMCHPTPMQGFRKQIGLPPRTYDSATVPTPEEWLDQYCEEHI